MKQAPPPPFRVPAENEKAILPTAKPPKTSAQPHEDADEASRNARLEELQELCSQGLELLKQVKQNEIKVDAKTLKEFKKTAYAWKAGANVGSPGGGELQHWMKLNPENNPKVAALEAAYWQTEFAEMLENEQTRNLFLRYLRKVFSSPEAYAKPAFEGNSQDVATWLTEGFGKHWRLRPPPQWWVGTLRDYIADPSSLQKEPPLPDGMTSLMADYLRDEVRASMVESFE